MKVKRTGRFKVKASHPDYEMIKLHTIEAKEIYNYANYIIRQLFFKKSGKENFSLDFINEYPELAEDFNIYILIEKVCFFYTDWIFPVGKFKVRNLSYI
jgi:hypothetical protein